MFSAIDRVMDKLERQILKYKEKIKRHKINSTLPGVELAHECVRRRKL